MDDMRPQVPRVALAALVAVALVVAASAASLGLLAHWQVPPGGETGSAALIAPIPQPRLQTAPQLDRAGAEAAMRSGRKTPGTTPGTAPNTPAGSPRTEAPPAANFYRRGRQDAEDAEENKEGTGGVALLLLSPWRRRRLGVLGGDIGLVRARTAGQRRGAGNRGLKHLAAALLFACVACHCAAASQDTEPRMPPRLGTRLPADFVLVDSNRRPVDWPAVAAAGRPIVLLPAYYRCDTLCGTVAHGTLEALADTGLPPDAWRLLVVSIDPADTPADAAPLREAYLHYAAWARPGVYAASPPSIGLLTGDAPNIARLAAATGLRWTTEPGRGDAAAFAHPAGLLILTPDGRLSRTLPGVRFDPAALRGALVEAADGRVGNVVDRLLLVCSHFDPVAGSADGWVLGGLRALGLVVLTWLGSWVWRHRHTASARAPR